MDENRVNENMPEGTDYEPNFIMSDPPEPQQAAQKPSQHEPQQTAQEPPKAEPQPGLYKDPRENFTRSSASWSGGTQRPTSGPTFYNSTEKSRAAVYNNSQPKKRKASKPIILTRKSLALLIAACLVLSTLFGFCGSMIGNSVSGGGSQTPVSEVSSSDTETSGYNLEDATGSNMSIQKITELAQKSVVEIKTEGAVSDSWLQQYVTEGAGSGVIISKDGYIVTNNHVIENTSKITVTTYDDHSYEAVLVGTDSTNDVAVIKVKATGLTPATFGNSDQLHVGDLAVAIGNPLGELGGTVTAGIISATDRELEIDGKTMKLLQTDSSINPGNSGGGLFNGDGQLIGIVVAKSSGSDVEGLGFAIPINTAANVAQQLKEKGFVSGQPWTGMTYTEGSSGFESFFGSSSGTVYIYSVDTSTAKMAGFKAGDVVFAVDGTQITSIDDLSSIITSHKVGDKLTFTIVRDGHTKDLNLKLQEKTKEQSE